MPVASAASNITVTHSFNSNPIRQDESGSIDITIKNNEANQIKITWIGIHFDWYDSNLYTQKSLSSNPEYLNSGESVTITLTYQVGTEISTGFHSYNIKIYGYEYIILDWFGDYWTGPTKYDYEIIERDRDGDEVGDSDDAFPDNILEWSDSDGDGVGNNADIFPTDSTEWKDTDIDGVGDNADAFPNDSTETVDTDGDGFGDNSDVFPTDPSESKDTDSDGVGDNADAFPNDSAETIDSDGDGTGDNSDVFPTDPSESKDTDSDGVGDNMDAFPTDSTETIDADGDGVGNNADAFPTDPSEWIDTDGDGIGDNADKYPSDPTNTPPPTSNEDSPASGDSSSSNAEDIDWNKILSVFLIAVAILLVIVGAVYIKNKKKSPSIAHAPSSPTPKKPVLLQETKRPVPRISIQDLNSSINVIFPSHVEEGATTEVIITLANQTKNNISDVRADFSDMEDIFEIDGAVQMKLLPPGMIMKKTIRIKPKHEEGLFPVKVKITGSGATIEKEHTIKVGGTEIY